MTAANDFSMPWLLEADAAAQCMVGALRRRRKVYDFPWQMAWFMKLVRRLPDWVLARAMSTYNEHPPMGSGPQPDAQSKDTIRGACP
jgi:hypothetical protein